MLWNEQIYIKKSYVKIYRFETNAHIWSFFTWKLSRFDHNLSDEIVYISTKYKTAYLVKKKKI